MASNPFDQFDVEASGNPFDQFDAVAARTVAQPPAPAGFGDFRDQYAGQGLAAGNLQYVKDYFSGIANAGPTPRGQTQPLPSLPVFGAAPGMVEAAGSLASAAVAPIPGAIDYALGKFGIGENESYAKSRDRYIYQPRTSMGSALTNTAGAVLKPVGDAFSLIGSGYGEIAREAGASPEAVADIRAAAPDVVGLGIGAGTLRARPRVQQPKPPTTEQLGKDAKAAYKRAEDAGVAVSAQSFDAFKMKLLDDMEKQGIDADLHPDATAALKRVASEKGPVTLEKLETLRRIALDAEASIKSPDSRLAGEIIDQLDEYVDNLKDADAVSGDPKQAAALKEARGFYSRKKKAEDIERLMKRAELSAPNFSASGMENAIRTEFRNLAKNERRMRRFTKEEQAAIERVAKGGPVENLARYFGKFAASGPMSAALSGGIGFAVGGPGGAAGLPAAGFASRMLATQMTKGNARAAHEIMRRGPPLVPAARPPAAPARAVAPPATQAAADQQRRLLIQALLRSASSGNHATGHNSGS
jgi:hypothetical protein